MPKKLVKVIAKGEYVDFGRFPILRDVHGGNGHRNQAVAGNP